MHDDDASDRNVEPDDEEATSGAVRDWAQTSSERLKSAAESRQGWLRALQADSRLAGQLAELGELSNRMVPGLQGALGEFARFNPQLPTNTMAIANALAALRSPAVGIPRFDALGWLGLADQLGEVTQRNARGLLPAFRSMQASLDTLNVPSFATQTQRFIAGTDALRYKGRQRVWHYTSASALDQIVGTHVLWASSPHHLNDASELVHGVGIVRDAIERLAETSRAPSKRALEVLRSVTDEQFIDAAMHEIYYISASGAPDSLTLWRNYSSNDGFAIGIRPNQRLTAEGLVLSQAETGQDLELPKVAAWYRVSYSDSRKETLADSFVGYAARDIAATDKDSIEEVVRELRKHLLILASTMKHRAFQDEREVRWITTNWAPVDVIHYEVTQRGFIPVLHVRSEGSSDESPHLPLAGLRCSPTASPPIERTMSALLRQRGYSEAAKDVVRSHLPFRG